MSVEIAAGLVHRYVESGGQDHDVVMADKILQNDLVNAASLTEGQVRAVVTTCRDLDHAAESMIAFLRSRGIPVAS